MRTKRQSDAPPIARSPARSPAPARAGSSDAGAIDRDDLTPETLPRVDDAASSSPPAPQGSSGSLTTGNTDDALRADEIERAKLFFPVILTVALGVGLALPVLGGDPYARAIFAAALAAYVLIEIWFVRAIRDPDAYNERNLALAGAAGVVAGFSGVFYYGIFSPAPAVVVMALYFNSLIGSARYTFWTFAACAATQATLATLVLTGAIVDRGLVTAASLTTAQQVLTQSLVLGALLATYLIARMSRSSTERQIQQLERAVRAVAHRDALLIEARQEIERAGWVGGPGRFTEQTIGRYKLGDVIGRGAMGEIYAAIDTRSGDEAAVKLLHRNVLADPNQLARFARELEAVARLDNPHVVRVFEVSPPSSSLPYLAMERLLGHDLAEELRKTRRMSVRAVVELVEHVAHGLEAARDAGIVHRDLKPQNIFWAQDDGPHRVWKILDFGVSKLADSTGTLTRGHVVGTPTYMSPEQARGRDVDHRSDVYALGSIAYRAITGHPAFSGRDVPKVLHDVAYKMPERPGALVPDLSPDIDAALAICLAKRADDRFDRALEFATALRLAARGELPADHRTRARDLERKQAWGGAA